MAVPFLVVFLADHPRPTRRQGSGGGPPPQDLRTAGQPPRKGSQVQTLSRPHTGPDQRKRELSVLLDLLAGSQRGWNEPAQRSRALYLLTSLCPCEAGPRRSRD